jgi:hypothetical protein
MSNAGVQAVDRLAGHQGVGEPDATVYAKLRVHTW